MTPKQSFAERRMSTMENSAQPLSARRSAGRKRSLDKAVPSLLHPRADPIFTSPASDLIPFSSRAATPSLPPAPPQFRSILPETGAMRRSRDHGHAESAKQYSA